MSTKRTNYASGTIRPRYNYLDDDDDKKRRGVQLNPKFVAVGGIILLVCFLVFFTSSTAVSSASADAVAKHNLKHVSVADVTNEGILEDEDEDAGDDEEDDDGHDDGVVSDDEEDEQSEDSNEEADDEEDDENEHPSELDITPENNVHTELKKLTLESIFVNLNHKSVSIDPSGSFKYVLVEAEDFEGTKGLFVQGCPSEEKFCKHPNAFKSLVNKLSPFGIESKMLGGGRITRHHLKHSKKKGLISVYGYSKTFAKKNGAACTNCNAQACALLSSAFPGYLVRYSNKGYSEKDEHKIKDWVKCSEQLQQS